MTEQLQQGTLAAMRLERQAVEELSRLRQEPSWLRERRLEAWRIYEETPMPAGQEEEWRRTDIRNLSLNGVAPFARGRSGVARPRDLPSELGTLWDERAPGAGLIVQHNSEVVLRELDEKLARKGVILSDLHTAAREHPELVQRYLMTEAVPPSEWKFVALHGALWSGGAFLYVPRGVEVGLPVSYVLGLSTQGLASFPHLLVVAEPGSWLTLIDESVSPTMEGGGFASGVVEIFVGEGAQVQYVNVQRWGGHMYGFNTIRARLGRDSFLQALMVGLGGRLSKTRLDVILAEPGARADLLGLSFGDGNQHFDYNTLQNHIAPHTASDLLFKSALKDRAELVWYGLVQVQPTASGSEASQTNSNLLLSDKAKAAPIPVLEIQAYDVLRCSHAATVGPVDQEQLFYLQTRGIPRPEAERMLVDGFFQDVVERIPSRPVLDRVMAALDAKLSG